MNLPCQGNECDQWPGSCLDHLVTESHTLPCVSFIALIKSLAFVLGEVGIAVGAGALRCEYFHFLFISHSYLARSWMEPLYDVSEMVFASQVQALLSQAPSYQTPGN